MPAAAATPPSKHHAAYENWRPPVVGVALLVPVGTDCLAVADLQGTLMLPAGAVHTGQAPEDAAQHVLSGPACGMQFVRRVAVDWVQMRRMDVITHVLAAAPTTRDMVERLVYRDPRATIRVMPTLRLIDQTWPTIQTRILVGLQGLATGQIACIEAGTVQQQPCGSNRRGRSSGRSLHQRGMHWLQR
ncbi:hypothetical protein [Streptomyces sp. BK340]|uniref:hypothetical protein n=1 Tax=Streptomyces sp. BK340 TaxID=2572903 RepID=UPI0011AC2259|nr:hypothetical protein [Streptomyces sp. BK340]TVZ84858.1 hypothetical protein FB157_120125 [Streptomyces sp. BK340]